MLWRTRRTLCGWMRMQGRRRRPNWLTVIAIELVASAQGVTGGRRQAPARPPRDLVGSERAWGRLGSGGRRELAPCGSHRTSRTAVLRSGWNEIEDLEGGYP